MTSATLIKTVTGPTLTRLVEYVGTDGTTYRLVDADGTPAEYGRTYVDHDGDEFVLTTDYRPTDDDPRVVVAWSACLPTHMDVEHNEALGVRWHFVRIAR